MTVKPFVKWAGGKTQLLAQIKNKYPLELGKTINKYCEPFIGGGAVLLDVLANYNLQEVLINDINADLINTYAQIKNNIDILLKELLAIQNQYWALDNEQRKEFYYQKRHRFNSLTTDIEKATLFIFLNKTCFNGLFRVNKKGLFNVPIGAYKQPLICDINNLKNINKLLQNVQISCGDYQQCESFIDSNTFVYIDPPYRPLSNTANFTAYADMQFGDAEQVALAKFIDKISSKGAKIVASNSDPKNTDSNDLFFDNLYDKFQIDRVNAKRMINSNANNRGEIKELLMSNFIA